MKCPNCGTVNGKTNKYCRDCGTRLDVLAPKGAKQDVPDVSSGEVRLGEELFAVHELFEADELEAALEKSEKLAADNPGSASAHAIVALVCERVAEQESSRGNAARARDFLKLAISRYENIIDLNPDSAADRGKLASLRLKYTGHVASTPRAQTRLGFADLMRSAPKSVLAAGVAFIAMIALVIVLTASPQAKRGSIEVTKQPQESTVTVTQSAPVEQPALSVYTFPQATNSPPVPTAVPKVPKPSQNSSSVEVRPMKIPKIDQELTLAPEPKATAAKKPVPEPPKASENRQPVSSSPSGATLFAQALRLHDQGKDSEAIGAANQAIVLYNAEVDAGKNVDTAKVGISTATKYISIWQKSMNGASE